MTTALSTETPLTFQTPAERLPALEAEAQNRGMSATQLTALRSIGDCPDQVKRRVQALEDWLAES